MMACAHCICPSFLQEHIGNSEIFNNVFMARFLQSDDQIILDREGRLLYKYVEVLQDQTQKYEVFKVWRMLLERSNNGKMLLTPSSVGDDVQQLVYDLASKANTTFNKDIVAHDNNHYERFLSELSRQRIQLLNLQNFTNSIINNITRKNINYSELDYDLSWVLHRLARRSIRSSSEDESNDYIRDMMLSKHYEIKDQTREGNSSSGLQAGELDLIIEDRGDLFAIVEAMRLTSLDSQYIISHYLKLLTSYNPLSVKRLFLITYYEGTRFDSFWDRYSTYIMELDRETLGLDDGYNLNNTNIVDTPFMGLKKLEHHFSYGNEHFACIHYVVRLANR
jgi:hypothetical protein